MLIILYDGHEVQAPSASPAAQYKARGKSYLSPALLDRLIRESPIHPAADEAPASPFFENH
jgi:hypothetical protein